EFQPDIVHAHYASSYGLLGSFLKHSSYFISVWGSDIFDFPNDSFIKKAIIKRNLRKAKVICSTSEVMAREANKYTNKQVHVVPFGVDIDRFKSTNKEVDPNELVFGIVKTLEDKYGISFLIDAFDLLSKGDSTSNHRLLIVGGGSKEKALKEQVHHLGLTDQVEFTGPVQHTEVPSYFNKMDVVVIPSTLDSESFGVAAVEASACEKPVIVSNVGGLPEVIIEHKTGLVAQPKNANDLFEKMKSLVESPESISAFGKAGRENVIEKYTWSDNVLSMIELYHQELNN
ncbi:MAG: glycosyltransferase, partial [Crocinitomicaceae bacterium]